jgi:hypothetical protein
MGWRIRALVVVSSASLALSVKSVLSRLVMAYPIPTAEQLSSALPVRREASVNPRVLSRLVQGKGASYLFTI